MRILFGVQGTGNGHISRARAMAPALRAQGVSVDFLFSGRPADHYFDMETFGDYTLRTGLSFAVRNGRIDYWQTMRQAQLKKFWHEVNSLDLSAYDLVLTDFEPVTAWAARRAGKFSIGISRQYAFRYDIPKVRSLMGDMIFARYAPADIEIGCHWHHFDQPLLPPIVEPNPFKREPNANTILVYLPFENLSALLALLQQIPEYRFELYHPDAGSAQVQGNVHVCRPGRSEFQQAMARCGGIIGNAGFELASEALQSGIPLLVKPLHGQMEQRSNVMNLTLLGLAESMEQLDIGSIRRWLEKRSARQIVYPDVAAALAAWIAAGAARQQRSLTDNAGSELQALSTGLWQQVDRITALSDSFPPCDNPPAEPAAPWQIQHG